MTREYGRPGVCTPICVIFLRAMGVVASVSKRCWVNEYIQDRIAIADVATAYSAAANRLAAREMELVLMPDAILGGVARMVGREDADVRGARAIGDLFASAFENLELVHQIPHIADLKIAADEAQMTTMIVEYVRPKGGSMMLMLGQYDDTLIRTAAGWRFSRRMFQIKSFGPLAT
jgi:SnoaL-like domain